MKIIVVTNADGTVAGTARPAAGTGKSLTAAQAPAGPPDPQPQPTQVGSLTALPGQTVREIDLPSALEGVTDADELHKALEKLLKQAKP